MKLQACFTLRSFSESNPTHVPLTQSARLLFLVVKRIRQWISKTFSTMLSQISSRISSALNTTKTKIVRRTFKNVLFLSRMIRFVREDCYRGYLRNIRKRSLSLASSREFGGLWRLCESKLCSRRKHNDWILTSKSGFSNCPMDNQWIPPGKHSACGHTVSDEERIEGR